MFTHNRRALIKLSIVEAKLFTRDRMSLFWGLAFPALLLVVLGAFFPGFRDPIEGANGFRLIDVYAPIVLGLAIATLAVASLPVYLTTYRQNGVLRRLATTPMPPGNLIFAQLAVQVTTAFVGSALAIAAGVLAFDIPFPQNPAGFALAFVLAAASLFAIGLLVGAVARTVSAGQGIGMALYFPMLFFAGVYFPRDAMPEGLRRVSDFTPIGAGVQAIQDSWFGMGPSTSNLIVMAAFAVGAGLLAAKLFRWE